MSPNSVFSLTSGCSWKSGPLRRKHLFLPVPETPLVSMVVCLVFCPVYSAANDFVVLGHA